jgi:hypothetical protein
MQNNRPEAAIGQSEDLCLRNGINYQIHLLSGQNQLHAVGKETFRFYSPPLRPSIRNNQRGL